MVGHNSHENISRVQEGGSSLLLFGTLIGQYNFEYSRKDDTGLGRWVSMVLQGQNDIVTRIVCAYNPYHNNKKGSRTMYQQHCCYFITKEKGRTCPRKRFRQDLEKKLTTWRENGKRLIVCMDANKNIYTKSIGRMLTDREGWEMKEVVGDFTGKNAGAIFFRVTTPIESVWSTPDVEVTGACVMPCGYGVGDHRLFVVDFWTTSLLGDTPPRVIRASARKLNNKIPRVAERYTKRLEKTYSSIA